MTAKNTDWTILKLLNWAADYFAARDIDSPRATAEILLAHALGVDRIALYLRQDQPLVAEELSIFKGLLKRRARREPVAYILGRKEFWSLDLAVSDHTLIPRPETESLVEAALTDLNRMAEEAVKPLTVLDMGTGSGAIVLALASEQPRHLYFAVDRSVQTVRQARRNAQKLLPNASIHFWCGHWGDAIAPAQAGFDLIVSNPPYIPSGQIDGLQPEIHRYEPRGALDGGANGLRSLDEIIAQAHQMLRPEGVLLLEIGWDQSDAVCALAADCGHYLPGETLLDYGGRDRVIRLQRRGLATHEKALASQR